MLAKGCRTCGRKYNRGQRAGDQRDSRPRPIFSDLFQRKLPCLLPRALHFLMSCASFVVEWKEKALFGVVWEGIPFLQGSKEHTNLRTNYGFLLPPSNKGRRKGEWESL
jgi:hypothetical protein